jgi:miniconductance mechanosensitive channel
MTSTIYKFLSEHPIPGIPGLTTELTHRGLGIVSILVLAFLATWITRAWVIRAFSSIVKKTKFTWDDVLVENKVLTRISHFAPALVVQALSLPFFGPVHGIDGKELLPASRLLDFANTFVSIYLVVIILLVIDATLNAINTSAEGKKHAAKLPLRGITQALKLIAYFIGIIFIIAYCFGKSPVAILSGLGALTAVLMLVFKDSLMGLVAGFQLSLNNMVQKGDWIEMPKHGADGDVLEVNLNSVRVQNWDKTISTIPTHELVTGSFKNWRGMQESGGRRIKRAIQIDMRTIQFTDESQLEKFKALEILKPYLQSKLDEVQQHNKNLDADLSTLANGRRLTNIGTFRAYCVAYLRNNSNIHQDGMTFLVRQLAPGPEGVAIELYVFANDIAWVNYEAIQGDIFDHLLAVLPEFDLQPYQKPSGHDMALLAKRGGT